MEDMRQGFQDRRPVYWLIRARMVKMVENVGNGGTEQDIGQTADTASTHRATDRDYEETD